MTDLPSAMGINPPSLYAAFGSKEALFRKAMDRYEASHGSYTPKALLAPTAREVAEQWYAVERTHGKTPLSVSDTAGMTRRKK